MAALQPVNPPLGVNPAYCVAQPTTLVLKEKAFSFSGDDFAITDAAGVSVLHCHGSALSIFDKKEFRDNNGQTLFTLKNQLLSIHKKFLAEGPNGQELFVVKGKFSSIHHHPQPLK
jgi:uncharacterized protein YxjI